MAARKGGKGGAKKSAPKPAAPRKSAPKDLPGRQRVEPKIGPNVGGDTRQAEIAHGVNAVDPGQER